MSRCESCNARGVRLTEYDDVLLCDEHLAKWRRRDALRADLSFTLAEWSKKHGVDERDTVQLVGEVLDDIARLFGEVREAKGVQA